MREGWKLCHLSHTSPVVRNQRTQNQLRIDQRPVVFPLCVPFGHRGPTATGFLEKGDRSPVGRDVEKQFSERNINHPLSRLLPDPPHWGGRG